MNIRAAITGGTGFIGAALVKLLLGDGGQVALLGRANSVHQWRVPDHPRLVRIHADLASLGECEEALKAFRPEVFLHVGWMGVGNQHRNDLSQLENIKSTSDSIRLASVAGCRRWVGTGSQAEYGPLNRRISEGDPLSPTNLYGAAKVSAWACGEVQGRQAGMEMIWARVFSTYGPGDEAGWMLTDVIGSLLKREIPQLTRGEQIWDYLYIEDAAKALLALAVVPGVAGVFNLGSGQARPIREIVTMARNLIDPALPLDFGAIPYRPDQVMHLEADIAKLTQATGWRPEVPLEVGLGNLIARMAKAGRPQL